MPKTNAEKCRDYRRRKNANKIKKKPKTSNERSIKFRARQKELLNKQKNSSHVNQNVSGIPNNDYQEQSDVPTANNSGVGEDGKRWRPNDDSLICCRHFVGNQTSNDPLNENYFPTLFPNMTKDSETLTSDGLDDSSDKPFSAVERNSISGSIETVVQKQQHETSCYKTKLLLQPVADLNAASSSNKSLGNVKHDTVSEIIETVIQEEPEICTKTTPVSDSFKESKIDWERAQSRFIDHVVMAYLNRCRSRAGSIKMTMPNYILKERAEQTALLLGTRLEASLNRLGWLESFKKKIIENDEKGVILTSFPESLNLIDIINDEWPIFATEYGLDDCEHPDSFSIENAEKNLMDTEIDPISDNHTCIMEVALDDLCSSSLSQPIEVTNISETTNHDLTPKFLKHVVKIFVKRFKATWPKANIPEFIYSAKLKEAAFILGYPIKKKQSIRVFKKSIQRKIARETDSTEPNQSFEMKDIIEEEMPKFNFDKQSSLTDESDLEDDNLCRANNKGCLMQIDDEGLDGIHTYEEAKDCLSLLQNYALEVKDLTAVALLDQINAYLRSEDCKD